MNFRLTVVAVLLLVAPIVCTDTARADAVTTSYSETGLNNREVMRWDFHCDVLADCSGTPADQMAWSSGVTADEIGRTLTFFSQHLRGPHVPFDVDPGEMFTLKITFAELVAIPNNPVFLVLGQGTVVHPAFPTHHDDIYTVFGRLIPGGFDFVITSTHVPEPATLLLLTTGLAGVTIKTRRRLKSRKRAQGSR